MFHSDILIDRIRAWQFIMMKLEIEVGSVI
ncbi:hypothetical protein PM8797T_26605 [Gimesia maris DSM 8797]|nr:hypothetical protein PM8797T_26605 [Gimesia maris DSM 8797]